MPKRFREADHLGVDRSGDESETSDGHIQVKSPTASHRRVPIKKASNASTPYMQAWIGLLGEITSHPTFVSGRMRLLAPYRKVREVPKAHLLRIAHQLRIELGPFDAFVHPARKGRRKTISARNNQEVSKSPTNRASPRFCPQSPEFPKEEEGSPPPDLKCDSPISDGNGKMDSPSWDWDASSEGTDDATASETADPRFELPDPATIVRHFLSERQKCELNRFIDGLDPYTKAWHSLLFHIICHPSFSSNRSAFMYPCKSLREMPKTQLLKIASDLKIDMTPYEAFVYPRKQDNLTVSELTKKKTVLNPYLAAWYSLVYAISSNERYVSNRDAFLSPYNKIREVPKAHLVRIASALHIDLSPYEAYVHPTTSRSRKRPFKMPRVEDSYISENSAPHSDSDDAEPHDSLRRSCRSKRASSTDSDPWEAPRKQPCNPRQTPYMKAWLGLLAEINAHAEFVAYKHKFLAPYTKIREVPKAHLLRIAALLSIDLVPFDDYVNPKHAGRPRRELQPGYTLEAEEVDHKASLEFSASSIKKRPEIRSVGFLRKALVAEIATNPKFIASAEKLLGSARQIGEMSITQLFDIARALGLDFERIKENGSSLTEYEFAFKSEEVS
mmetsp:Transcript_20075/g.34554  ORF Transcript_20075/g.34554 Transcript_20075/m.34554 type:complete len:615 (-) Transcript_20075:676-2520(-)|eukprot:CAMPEP_0196656716 /NCGR_PEP_ID=MMETSP1086-20130531/19397_1 /TAXON_ID=77921 /ORGANISM="Cyanoptyche  gloeocystis , Strain SAG4.97" /LENGTH=614 /DNA_ID=CAMNT_0041989569 /DNA_START=172 /DNA_END=2016 /DNA_ORIENTATION=-